MCSGRGGADESVRPVGDELGEQGTEGAAEAAGSPTRYTDSRLFSSDFSELHMPVCHAPLFIAGMQSKLYKWSIILRNGVDILMILSFDNT